jgi:hypothetical protein
MEIKKYHEEVLKELHKLLDNEFKNYEESAKLCTEYSTKLRNIIDDVKTHIANRIDKYVTTNDLDILSSIIALQLENQSCIASLNHYTLRRLKEIAYVSWKLTLDTADQIYYTIPTILPEFSAILTKKMEEKITALEKELKEELTVEIPERFDKTFEWLEEQMKAWQRGQEHAKRMRS